MSNGVDTGLAKAAGVVGILAGLCGIGECVCGFMWVSYNGLYGHGLWSGFGLIVAAVLGVVIWGTRNKIAMIFFLVVCIILINVMAVQTVLAALLYTYWTLFLHAVNCRTYGGECNCLTDYWDGTAIKLETCDAIALIDGLFLAMTILSALGVIFSLAGSIIGCIGTCCSSNRNQQGGVVVVQQPVGNQATVMCTTSQYSTAGYPAQYPPAPGGQYPPGQAVQYPPPQYPMVEMPGGVSLPGHIPCTQGLEPVDFISCKSLLD